MPLDLEFAAYVSQLECFIKPVCLTSTILGIIPCFSFQALTNPLPLIFVLFDDGGGFFVLRSNLGKVRLCDFQICPAWSGKGPTGLVSLTGTKNRKKGWRVQ